MVCFSPLCELIHTYRDFTLSLGCHWSQQRRYCVCAPGRMPYPCMPMNRAHVGRELLDIRKLLASGLASQQESTNSRPHAIPFAGQSPPPRAHLRIVILVTTEGATKPFACALLASGRVCAPGNMPLLLRSGFFC